MARMQLWHGLDVQFPAMVQQLELEAYTARPVAFMQDGKWCVACACNPWTAREGSWTVSEQSINSCAVLHRTAQVQSMDISGAVHGQLRCSPWTVLHISVAAYRARASERVERE